MRRIFTISDRDLKNFFRSPIAIIMTLFFPLILLLVFGNLMFAQLTDIPIGVTQEDLFLTETPLFTHTIEALQETDYFELNVYTSESEARRDLIKGKLYAIAVFPGEISSSRPIRLYLDSSEYVIPDFIESKFREMISVFTDAPTIQVYQIYGKIDYLEFLGVAIIVLAIFLSSMMGGGTSIIKDKMTGTFESYLATPIKRYYIVLGLVASGTIKAMLAGIFILTMSIFFTGLEIRNYMTLFEVIVVIFLISVGITSFVVSFAFKFSDINLYMTLVAFLNIFLFLTSGAVYPVIASPDWLRLIILMNPETYAIHALRCILLKEQALPSVISDVAVILLFSFLGIIFGVLTFPKTLED